MRGSLIIQWHSYRGFDRIGGPLLSVVTLGWVSVSYLPFLLTDWLHAKVNALKGALRSDETPPRAEMSCWGTERPYHKRVYR